MVDLPEGLSELQRFVDDALALLVVAQLSVALIEGVSWDWSGHDEALRTEIGKSLRRGWPSKP